MLSAGQLDLGLVGKPEHLRHLHFDFAETVEDIFVTTEEYLRNVRLRGVEEARIFEHATMMLLDKNNFSRQYIDRYFLLNQISLSDVIEVSNMDLLIDFAKIGIGIACVIRRFVETELSTKVLIALPLPTPVPKRQIGFVYADNHPKNHALEEFLGFCREHGEA